MNLSRFYENCRLCPFNCRVNRIVNGNDKNRLGACGETDQLKVAYVGPHFGEEPPISGKRGSGTVFFSGCSLKCSYCQNYQISHEGLGTDYSLTGISIKLEEMIRKYQVHNINFVTPDHFFPHVFHMVSFLRKKGNHLPVICNMSGFQSKEMLSSAEEFVDIYLPDYKYSDSSLAARFSGCRNYPTVAIDAIAEMLKQKDFLDACRNDSDIATKGVLVRHLILPGRIDNSLNALTSLFIEFGSTLPVSLMSQYRPVLHHKDRELNRMLSEEEFKIVHAHAMELGFEHLFVQFPEADHATHMNITPFLPDFRMEEPFK